MRRIFSRIFLFSLLAMASCLIKPPDPVPQPWTKLEGLQTINNIRIMHATPGELYILSDDEFVRLDFNNEPVEKRKFDDIPLRFYGRPALSDDTFYRMIRNDNEQVEMDFFLTRNPEPSFKIEIHDFLDPGDSGFAPEDDARNTGVYNADGSQFIVPVIQLPDFHYVFLLFDINLNLTKTEFESIELARRIDIEDFPADANNLNNVKFIDGYFYATSLDGAVRIDPATGSYQKIFEEWMLDFFKFDNKIYATGFGNTLYVSEDNGLNFTAVDLSAVEVPLQLQMVELANDQILTQQAVGFPFSVIQPDFSESKKLLLNEDFTLDFSAYQDLKYFQGNYYLPVFKELYYSPELFTE